MMIWMSLMRKLLAKGSLLSGLSMVATPQCTHLHGRGYMIFCVMLTTNTVADKKIAEGVLVVKRSQDLFKGTQRLYLSMS